MREELAKRVGCRGEYTATFCRWSFVRNKFGTLVTALLLDLHDERGERVSDHQWMPKGKQLGRLNPMPGDRIRFTATVVCYEKRNGCRDYELGHPWNMRIARGEEPPASAASLSLFDPGPEAS